MYASHRVFPVCLRAGIQCLIPVFPVRLRRESTFSVRKTFLIDLSARTISSALRDAGIYAFVISVHQEIRKSKEWIPAQPRTGRTERGRFLRYYNRSAIAQQPLAAPHGCEASKFSNGECREFSAAGGCKFPDPALVPSQPFDYRLTIV